jgi:hypothetical protein
MMTDLQPGRSPSEFCDCRSRNDTTFCALCHRPKPTSAFTENEIKDVLTALYQDGHVDLVLADRVAALMRGRA